MERGIEPSDFNSYGARRGNHEVMVRGTFANIRLRNALVPRRRGRRDALPADRRTDVDLRRGDEVIKADGTPLVVLAGKEYGSGSSRDWAAKGPYLLGVKAVIAESFERIHRSNLHRHGRFAAGVRRRHERLDATASPAKRSSTSPESPRASTPRMHVHVKATDPNSGRSIEFQAARSHRYARRSRILPPRRHPTVRLAPTSQQKSLAAVSP